MAGPLISPKTRLAFREYLVEDGTLRTIDDAFSVGGVSCAEDFEPQVRGQRRTLVEQYYHTVNWEAWSDVRKVLSVYEHLLVELDIRAQTDGDDGKAARDHLSALSKRLEHDGFRFEGGRLHPTRPTLELDGVGLVASRLDAPELHRQIQRIHENVDDDPALAVGTAKELLETTCKTILHERGREADSGWSVVRLVKEVRAELGLLPQDVPAEPVKPDETLWGSHLVSPQL